MSLADHKRLFARAMADAQWTRDATLVSVATTRNPADLTGGPTVTETTVRCRGLVVSWKGSRFLGTEVQAGDRVVHLIGESLGSTTPKIGDKVTIEGATGRVINLDRDGAAAVWICLVRA